MASVVRMTMRTRRTACLGVSLLVVAAYIFSYVRISSRGRFEPTVIGLNGVKIYGWAPEGFVSEFKWSRPKLLFYYPLHLIDTRFFHSSNDASGERFPIDEVSKEEIGKVYQAWGLMKTKPSNSQ